MADDLEEILAGCRAGDSQAQRLLYERFHRMVYRLAARMLGNRDTADVVQEIFLRVFAGLAGFRGAADFATWLYRVAVNECLRQRRRHQPRLKRLTDEQTAQTVSPDSRLEQVELLQKALERLDDRLRAIFLLREAEGPGSLSTSGRI